MKVSNIPIAGLGVGPARQSPRDRAPARGVTGGVDGVATVVLHDRDGPPARADRTGRASCCRSGRAGSRGSIPQDIAEVAAAALTRDIDGPLAITGPEALDGDEVAARLGVRRLDPPLDEWRDAVVADGLDPWLADSTVELYRRGQRGRARERVTRGRARAGPARPPASFANRPVVLLRSNDGWAASCDSRANTCVGGIRRPTRIAGRARTRPRRRAAPGRCGSRRRRTRRSRPSRRRRRCRT